MQRFPLLLAVIVSTLVVGLAERAVLGTGPAAPTPSAPAQSAGLDQGGSHPSFLWTGHTLLSTRSQRHARTAAFFRVPTPGRRGDRHRVVAILLTVVALRRVEFCTLYTPDQFAHPTGFASPPFIPPKVMRRVQSA